MITKFKVFYKNVFSHLKTTGSLAPSSRYLSEAMVRIIEPKDTPLTILEAGPGTGPFTIPLIRRMGTQDHLDLCELNDGFIHYLKTRFEDEPMYHRNHDRIEIFHCPVQELQGTEKYDYIVSSLPFNNFEPELVLDILNNYRRMIKPGGSMSFFEYAFVRNVKKAVVRGNERIRIERVGEVITNFVNEHAVKKEIVLLNFPPARVYYCQL